MTQELAERIENEVRRLPEALAWEVLKFIGYLEFRHGLRTGSDLDGLMMAQEEAMRHVWDNPDDEVWNDVPTR
ncbi:MAG: hypothetical protein HQL97_13380 [Magnetococcales bacterium]|nr:hypothetical protein [Magnetococcales bacterium]MBF0262814.1 hypothetical protein [Magnetococcales bacterium]